MIGRYSIGIGILALMAISVTGFNQRQGTAKQADDPNTEISVAVASNFIDPIKTIAQNFEKQTGYKVILSFGSTGRHYAQIKNGAPFEVFLAADTRRPQLLDEENLAIDRSRFTYAIGGLVLWSPYDDFVDSKGKVLEDITTGFVSIANPKLAPYGIAAMEVLQKLGQWDRLQDRMVRGENIGQAYQFVKSGNAKMGFVASSQVMRSGEPYQGSLWMIPQELYTPIEQQAVLIKDNVGSRAFMEYLKSPEAMEIIESYGYRTP